MILNRIKLNYNIKLLDDCFLHEKYEEASDVLFKNRKNPEIYFNLVNYIHQKYLFQNQYKNFFRKKFIWIVSYDKRETSYINTFLDFYLNSQNIKFGIENFSKCYSQTMKDLKVQSIPKKLNFNELINQSQIIQTLIQQSNTNDYLVLSTDAAFFEAPNNKFLIYPNNSLCYFAIIKNPVEMYKRVKSQSSNNQEALNYMMNYDLDAEEELLRSNDDEYSVIENRQNWNTHTKSWTDDNVQNSCRGKIIKFNELLSNTYELLVDVIFHLKQAGMPVDVDYDKVKEFMQKHKIENDFYDIEISNNELKMISNSFDKGLLENLEFKLDN
jgi:hypothetical protein